MLKVSFVVAFAIALGADLGAQSNRPARPQITVEPSPQTHVHCGITILPADPRIDQQLVKPTPPGHFALRTVRPAVCLDTFAIRTDELKQRLRYFFEPKR